MSIIILKDTREQKGWDFLFDDVSVTSATLRYGDYTSANLCDKLRIERKSSTGELYNNLSTIKMKTRFHKELTQLKNYEVAYVVCEFPESDLYCFPRKSTIPEDKWASLKMNTKYFRKLVRDIEDQFDIPVVFCNNKEEAELFSYNIISSLEKNEWNY